MFSTPSSRLVNRENTDSVMRKPHVSSARKAFQDRSINSKLSQPLKNTPMNKAKINLFCDLKAKETIPPEDVPTWAMETSTVPPEDEISYSHYTISKEDIYNLIAGQLPTPPPSPVQYCNLDMEILQLPTPMAMKFKFRDEEENALPAPVWEDDDYDLPWERPQISFDY